MMRFKAFREYLYSYYKRILMGMGMSFKTKYAVATKIVAADGTGDFSDIQDAIDDLPSGGGVVYVKEGTYTITSAITITKHNVSIRGAGKSTIITTSKSINLLEISANNCHFDRLFLNGNSLALYGLLLTGNNAIIRNLWADVCSTGILAYSTAGRNIIANCIISNSLSVGIRCYLENLIYNCIISNSGSDGMEIIGDKSVIKNNKIYSSGGIGINAAVTNKLNISSNEIYENEYSGIYMSSGEKNIISNNQIHDNDVSNTNTYSGIQLYSSDKNVISNNVCSGNDKHDIELEVNSTGNTIIGNICPSGTISIVDKINNEIGHNVTS